MDAAVAATEYDPSTSGVDGFLIDLDGTMYQPGGLLHGASDFYRKHHSLFMGSFIRHVSTLCKPKSVWLVILGGKECGGICCLHTTNEFHACSKRGVPNVNGNVFFSHFPLQQHVCDKARAQVLHKTIRPVSGCAATSGGALSTTVVTVASGVCVCCTSAFQPGTQAAPTNNTPSLSL